MKNTFVQTVIEEIKKNNKLPRTKTLLLEDILTKDTLLYLIKNFISFFVLNQPGLTLTIPLLSEEKFL